MNTKATLCSSLRLGRNMDISAIALITNQFHFAMLIAMRQDIIDFGLSPNAYACSDRMCKTCAATAYVLNRLAYDPGAFESWESYQMAEGNSRHFLELPEKTTVPADWLGRVDLYPSAH